MSKEKLPLTDEDFLGLVDVLLKRPPIQSRSMPNTMIFIVDYNGQEYRISVIGKEALESVKSHGYKDSEGKIHLQVPKICLREEGCGWINSPY
ncbi:MAG: hypothetical protein QW175_05840 [Candidatus Bathyarchaeia archaeon]